MSTVSSFFNVTIDQVRHEPMQFFPRMVRVIVTLLVSAPQQVRYRDPTGVNETSFDNYNCDAYFVDTATDLTSCAVAYNVSSSGNMGKC